MHPKIVKKKKKKKTKIVKKGIREGRQSKALGADGGFRAWSFFVPGAKGWVGTPEGFSRGR